MSTEGSREPQIWALINLKSTMAKKKKGKKRKMTTNESESQKVWSKKRKMMEQQGSEVSSSDCNSYSVRPRVPSASPRKVAEVSSLCSFDSAALSSDSWDVDSGFASECSPPVSGRSSPCVGIDPSMLLALDCEMVGTGPNAQHSELARCSLLNYYGVVIYDKYILPCRPVTDYRTPWSGIKKEHLEGALPFKEARQEILSILKGKVIIGHALKNDFRVLGIRVPPSMTRDTSCMGLLRQMCHVYEKNISLKMLAGRLLNRSIQTGRVGHCSVEDARAALDLYKLIEEQWEKYLQASDHYYNLEPEAPTSLECYMQDQYWPESLTNCNQ